jgi:hypothetical protein
LTSLVIAALVGILFLLGLMGGADFYATLLLTILLPAPPRWMIGLPPVVVVTLYAAILSIIHSILAAWSATGKFTLNPRLSIDAERLLADPKMKWWIPTGAIVEDPEDALFEIATKNGQVKVSYGTPHVTHMLIGLILYLAFGGPLTLLLG